MRKIPSRLPALFLFLLACLAAAPFMDSPATAQDEKDTSPYSQAELVSEVGSIEPGKPFTVALRLQMDPGWHSYWINPGDAGLPTKMNWSLPEGFTAGEIQWPYPEKIDTPPLVSYGYEDEVWLLMDITPPADLQPGQTIKLAGQAEWLICREICLPAKEQVSLQLPVSESSAVNERWSENFAKTRKHLPVSAAALGYTVRAEAAAAQGDESVSLRFQPPGSLSLSPEDLKGAHFFVGKAAALDHAASQEVTRAGNELQIELRPSEYSEGPLKRLSGVLLAPEGKGWDAANEVRAMSFDVAIDPPGTPAPAALASPSADSGTSGSADAASTTLGLALLLAFGGGLLLNLMPCVFPVLSLKILNFVQKSGEDKAKIRKHGFAFGAGVLSSFWVLAGGLLALRAAGGGVGWGYQLQSPVFVGALALLMFLVGLNLLGAFEVGLGLTRLDSSPANAPKSGYSGSFASGVLATVVATPCTAPFMGAALGYAMTQSAPVALGVFTSLGIGMALPYVLLSMNPKWLQRLPRPGAWMETFKQFMAFPMFATALWLLAVFGLQTGVEGMALLLVAFLLTGFAIWMLRRWGGASARAAQMLSRTVAAVVLLTALLVAWRGVGSMPETTTAAVAGGKGSEPVAAADWQPFSTSKIAELRAAGQPVFVDFTAAWCITCQVNKRTTLSRPNVMNAFAERGVTLMRADWTRRDPEISQALENLGRSGVPVYALYLPTQTEPEVEPILLPEVLSESVVLNALKVLPIAAGTTEEEPTRQASQLSGAAAAR